MVTNTSCTCFVFVLLPTESKEELWVTPFSVVAKKNREVLRLYGKDVCR